MHARDKVEGLHSCRELSQPFECLYQAMHTQDKVFYCFYKITCPRKEQNSLFMALIKRGILTSREVLNTKFFTLNHFFQNTDFSLLKC